MSMRMLALALLVACGGSEPAPPPAPAPAKAAKKEAPKPKPKPKPAEAIVVKPDADGVAHVEASDMMKYNTGRIEVEGTTFKIELKHVGSMAKTAMGHNLVVLQAGTDPVAWAGTAVTAAGNDYIPEDASAIIAHTKLLGGGESDTIEVVLPGPGEYPFVCSFPGHAAIMQGVIVAK